MWRRCPTHRWKRSGQWLRALDRSPRFCVAHFSSIPPVNASGEGSGLPKPSLASLPVAFEVLGLKYLEQDVLRERFDSFDLDRDGEIDLQEARGILEAAKSEDTSEEAASALIGALDSDGKRRISWESFRAAVDKAAEPVDRRILPISFSLGFHFTALGLQAPCLPLLARSFGIGVSELGLISAGGALVRIALNLPAARAVDIYGRRPLLIGGPALGAIGMVGMAFSTSFVELAACSALLGAAGTMIQTGAGLYLSDISTPKNRAQTMAPLMTMALLGFSIGPATGGFVAQHYGLQAPFMLCAAGMTMASVSAMALLTETMHLQGSRSSKGQVQEGLAKTITLLMRPALQGIMTTVVIGGFTNGAAPVTAVLLASETLGLTPAQIGMAFTANVVGMGLCVPIATRLSDKAAASGRRLYVMLPGMAVQASGLLAQSLSSSMEVFMLCGVVSAMGQAFVLPNVSAFIMDNTSADERSQALAMQRISQDVGMLFGASTMGFLAASAGVPFAMQTTAALQACAALFCALRAAPSCRGSGG